MAVEKWCCNDNSMSQEMTDAAIDIELDAMAEAALAPLAAKGATTPPAKVPNKSPDRANPQVWGAMPRCGRVLACCGRGVLCVS